MGIVTDIMDTIDGGVSDAGEQFFNATAAGVMPFMTIACTILLVFVGINMAVGYYKMGPRDSIQLATRIVLVWLFAFSWSNFSVLYEAFTEIGNVLAVEFFDIASNSTKGDIYAAFDSMSADMANTADGVAKAQGSIMRGVVGALLYCVLAIMMAIYVLIVAFAKIMIAFLLGIAPLAMVATIFNKTRNLFEAWLGSFIGYLMYPIGASAIISAIILVADQQFRDQDEVENIGQILGFCVVVFVGIFALKQIPTAVTNISGAVHLANITPEALRMGQGAMSRMPGAQKVRDAKVMMDGFKRGTGQAPEDAKKARERDLRERGARIRQVSIDRANFPGRKKK